ncbi:DUF699-domain-containing protein [Phlegmacium glaucopus]|nr:DUF699-domain-containing protein [Phlegmacium glaucopus]
MHVMPSRALLTSSIQYGIVARSRSLPLTGRILPGYLDTSGGSRVGLGIGNPNAKFTPDISACAISSDGGTAKVVWGTRAGDVLFMNVPRAMDGGRRNVADVQKCNMLMSTVVPFSMLSGLSILPAPLWDGQSSLLAPTGESSLGCQDRLNATQTRVHGDCIAAVMKSGEIHVWKGFALGSTAIYEETSIRDTIIKCPMCTSTPGYDPQTTHAVIALHVDPNSTSALPTLLVAYENDPFLYRVRVVPYFRGTAEQASFVLVGDHLGWVSLYAWAADNPSLSVSNSIFISTSIGFNSNPSWASSGTGAVEDAHILGQVELVIIDEAAASPPPLVRNLIGPHLVFLALTINSYGGTGRSLSLKLISQLIDISHLYSCNLTFKSSFELVQMIMILQLIKPSHL